MNFDKEYETSNIFSLSNNEEIILEKWKETDVLGQLKLASKDSKEWKFLDGPPFVNGNPHHGHLLVSTIKDVLSRYHSNLGYKISYQLFLCCLFHR